MEKLDFEFSFHGWAEEFVVDQGKLVSLNEEIFIDKEFILNKLKEVCQAIDKINLNKSLENISNNTDQYYVLQKEIDYLQLDKRLTNQLYIHGYNFIHQLIDAQLHKEPNIGRKSVQKIQNSLKKFNLRLKGTESRWLISR